jgi:hypothetical protein
LLNIDGRPGRISRSDLPDQFKTRRNLGYILSPNRKSIACGAGKWREIAIGQDGLGEYPAGSGEEINGLCFSGQDSGGVLRDDVPGFLEAHNTSRMRSSDHA